MSKRQSNSLLRMLESGFFTVGIVLLAGFVFLRAWGNHQASSDIEEFEQAMLAQQQGSDMQQAAASSLPEDFAADRSVSASTAGTSTENRSSTATKYSPEPDYELWSDKRIGDYHAGNIERDDPPLAILTIDKLDLKVPVYDGTDEINLNRGAGRIKGTGRIDAAGNMGIAGHRDGFFRALKDIEVGDSMDMLTFQGKSEFVVSSITIVDPSDVSVLAPTDDATITLVTCYPFYFVGHAPKRYIVKGELVPHQVNKS